MALIIDRQTKKKEKNMYKIIKNNTFTMASYESKKEAYNAILSIFFEITKNVPANSIEMINAKDRFDFLIDGKLFAFYQLVEFDANADENDKNSDSCWYEERWYDSDLKNALLYHEVPVTENTMRLMRENANTFLMINQLGTKCWKIWPSKLRKPFKKLKKINPQHT